MKKILFSCFLISVFLLISCSNEEEISPIAKTTNYKLEVPEPTLNIEKPINQIMTTKKLMALTFNGLADRETMIQLLDILDNLDIKATFFLQGMRVAEEPELVKELIQKGHTIQNNTLNHILPENITYEEAYAEIALANQIFLEKLGIEPIYIRSRSGETSENLQMAAAQLGLTVVTHTINPQDRQMQPAEEIADYINRFATRGAVIQLNTYLNPAILEALPLIHENAKKKGYTLTTLEEVHSTSYMQESELAIASNNLKTTNNYEETQPTIITKFQTAKKEVALTFDDWASDETISKVLEILNTHNIKSTFFLIGKGVENNPQLAKLILTEGHEIANHSYNHVDVTTMSSTELQEDVIKTDEILTSALQEKPLNYFRPAQGIVDDESAKIIAATGVDYIMLYDVASLDWNLELSEDEVFNRVINKAKPGSIITMHILDGAHTINVLPRIIEALQKQGYEFKKLSEWVNQLEQ